jgi:hypothetical protein
MDKETRNRIQRATQAARTLLEQEYAEQLEGVFDIRLDGAIAKEPGEHLAATQRVQRTKLVTAMEHLGGAGRSKADAVATYLREAAFTTLNRFVALKMLEARELTQECVTRGEQSAGFKEFTGLAPGLVQLPDHGYRAYLESIFDELSTEVKVLFERRDARALLWPKRATMDALLELLNAEDLSEVWAEDETIGWVYQFFNGEDERKQMRAESQAPRNSREMAVRNQFFTPRYVVQFLTDNTLGRIWYEMRRKETALAGSCEYMVRKPDETFTLRTKKDPRDLRVLDPACGSGHFLLYAFDLLLPIYKEAYADPESPKSEATGKTLAQDYPTLEGLRNALPGLILAHNLHGVDIDARCAQIAQLALWMRAQRAYRDLGIGRAARAPIRKSNIVVAEPICDQGGLVAEFASTLKPPVLGQVFTQLVESSRLAGDMGLLLRLEQALEGRLEEARRQFSARERELSKGYLPGFEPVRKQGELDLSGVTRDFFADAAARIMEALEQFVTEYGGSNGTRQRLFAEDAAQGMGLLALAEKKYDVVLMNPPFGAGSTRAKKDFEKAYPRTKNDVYAAFVERGIELLSSRGRVGAITSRTGFFLKSYRKWREEILLGTAPPVVVADLGLGVMDAAMVESAAYCLEHGAHGGGAPTTFFRILEELFDKEAGLRRAVLSGHKLAARTEYVVDPSSFAGVPGAPFAYWVGDDLRRLFSELHPFESQGRLARHGLATHDDFRWLRLAWESPNPDCAPMAKGGEFSPIYADIHLSLHWGANKRSLKASKEERFRRGEITENNSKLWSEQHYFRPGLTWSRRTKSELSMRVLPAGCVFADKGPGAFAPDDDPESLMVLLAVSGSTPFRALVELQLAAADAKKGGAARSYEVGVIQSTPVPEVSDGARKQVASRARRAWSLKRLLDTTNETSHAFVLPPGTLGYEASPLHPTAGGFNRADIERELAAIQVEIDDKIFALYGISDEDRATIETSMTRGVVSSSTDDSTDAESSDDTEDSDDDEGGATVELTATTLTTYSWLVGVAFGRFDPRLATRERAIPPEPEPFDPLPACSPGMWPADEEDSVASPDIMVDDPGHDHDLRTLVANAAAKTGWPEPDDLRQWLAKEFFPLHIKMYSRSRRMAPIYWQLATPSASFSVWLYIHAFTKDTLFRVQNDYVASKLAHEQRKLESLQAASQDGQSATDRKELGNQESLVEELRAFLGEVKRVAPLWNPNLDDGVIINFSLLWRLVPQHKTWQKELKTTWDALCAGNYDWAHLAMHLWPERVVPKCAEDRSLAIAHGLEEVFWIAGSDGKWAARKTPSKPIAELVRERTSPAVQDALKQLLNAPTAGAGGVKKKAPREASARVDKAPKTTARKV